MKYVITFFILLLTYNGFSQNFDFYYNTDFSKILEETKNKESELYYPTQIIRFIKNDTTLTDFEVLALLIGFTDDENYNAYGDITLERDIYSLSDEGTYEEAITKGLDFIKTHPCKFCI